MLLLSVMTLTYGEDTTVRPVVRWYLGQSRNQHLLPHTPYTEPSVLYRTLYTETAPGTPVPGVIPWS